MILLLLIGILVKKLPQEKTDLLKTFKWYVKSLPLGKNYIKSFKLISLCLCIWICLVILWLLPACQMRPLLLWSLFSFCLFVLFPHVHQEIRRSHTQNEINGVKKKQLTLTVHIFSWRSQLRERASIRAEESRKGSLPAIFSLGWPCLIVSQW